MRNYEDRPQLVVVVDANETSEMLESIEAIVLSIADRVDQLAITCATFAPKHEAEVERLRAALETSKASARGAVEVQDGLRTEVERLQKNLGAMTEAIEGWQNREARQRYRAEQAEAEVERLRAVLGRVEEAVRVIEGTRYAEPPMDASECVVVLRQALERMEGSL